MFGFRSELELSVKVEAETPIPFPVYCLGFVIYVTTCVEITKQCRLTVIYEAH